MRNFAHFDAQIRKVRTIKL